MADSSVSCIPSSLASDTGNTQCSIPPVFSQQLETSNTAELPPGRYLLRRLDGDGIAKGYAWLAEIRILSAFPEDG